MCGLAEEVLKMQAFHHLHVMSLIGVCLDSGAGPAIVMPYMANGSLLDYLRKERDSLLLDENASSNKVFVIEMLYACSISYTGGTKAPMLQGKLSLVSGLKYVQ